MSLYQTVAVEEYSVTLLVAFRTQMVTGGQPGSDSLAGYLTQRILRSDSSIS
jgi:hypothetical protein